MPRGDPTEKKEWKTCLRRYIDSYLINTERGKEEEIGKVWRICETIKHGKGRSGG